MGSHPKHLMLKSEIFRTAARRRGAVRAISATTNRMFPLSAPHCFTGHQNNATIEFFFKRVNATVLMKPFNLTALGINVRFHAVPGSPK